MEVTLPVGVTALNSGTFVEHCEIDGREFVHTYSDANRYVVCGDEVFEEVHDLPEYAREYEEGDYIPPRDETDDDELRTVLGLIVDGE